MVAYADSLRHGLDIVARFGRLVSAGPLYQLTEHAAEATLCVVPQEAPGGACKRFASDMRLVGFLRMLRAFDDHMRVVRVHLAHPAPSYAQEYARVFESPIHFEAGFTGIVFERDLLDASSSYRDEDICHALQGGGIGPDREVFACVQWRQFNVLSQGCFHLMKFPLKLIVSELS